MPYASPEWIWGFIAFGLTGAYYGFLSDDVRMPKALLIGLAANLMAFSVFGTLLTLAWIVLWPFGILVRVQQFGASLGSFILLEMLTFITFYLLAKTTRKTLPPVQP